MRARSSAALVAAYWLRPRHSCATRLPIEHDATAAALRHRRDAARRRGASASTARATWCRLAAGRATRGEPRAAPCRVHEAHRTAVKETCRTVERARHLQVDRNGWKRASVSVAATCRARERARRARRDAPRSRGRFPRSCRSTTTRMRLLACRDGAPHSTRMLPSVMIFCAQRHVVALELDESPRCCRRELQALRRELVLISGEANALFTSALSFARIGGQVRRTPEAVPAVQLEAGDCLGDGRHGGQACASRTSRRPPAVVPPCGRRESPRIGSMKPSIATTEAGPGTRGAVRLCRGTTVAGDTARTLQELGGQVSCGPDRADGERVLFVPVRFRVCDQRPDVVHRAVLADRRPTAAPWPPGRSA